MKSIKIDEVDNGFIVVRVVAEGQAQQVTDTKVFLNLRDLLTWMEQVCKK